MTEFGIKWAEEPSSAGDVIGRKCSAAAVPTRVSGDECTRPLDEATREILRGITRGLCIKTTRSGYTTSGKLAAVAEAFQVQDGKFAPRNRPGLGGEIDDAKLQHCRIIAVYHRPEATAL